MKQARLLLTGLLITAFLLGCAPSPAARLTYEQTMAQVPLEVVQVQVGDVQQSKQDNKVQPIFAAAGDTAGEKNASDLFRVQFEGNAVTGTGEVRDGKYRIQATKTDGEAWHIKLESNYPTTPGNDYRITYSFTSDTAGKVKFGDVQEFSIVAGRNEITGIISAVGGTTYLDLQLGMLKPFTIDVEKITVADLADTATFTSILPDEVPFASEQATYEQHDEGYAQSVARTADAVTLSVEQIPADAEVWKSKLFIRTSAVPQAGKRYRVSADVKAEKEQDFEICYNNGDTEKGYAALYGQRLNAETKTFAQTFSVPESGFAAKEVVLQLMVGKSPAGNRITVSNVRVEEIKDQYRELLPTTFAMDDVISTGVVYRSVPKSYANVALKDFVYDGTDTAYEGHDEGYVIETVEKTDGVDFKIVKAPEKSEDRGVWKAKLYVDTGVVPEASKTYRLSFDLTPEKDQAEYEVCFDGSSENDYGALYGRALTAGKADHVEHVFIPAESKGTLTLRLQLGKTDSASGNSYTFRNLKVEQVTTETQSILPSDFSYPEGTAEKTENNSFELETNNGTAAKLTGDGSSATATVTRPGDDWHVKLYAKPGIELEAGQTYTVTMNVTGADGCTACYKNTATGAEDGFGTEVIGSGTVTHTVTPTESGMLEILLKIGNVPANTDVKVSNIQITKGSGGFAPIKLSSFGYPVSTEAQTSKGSFDLEANSGAEAVLTGNGSSATATVTKSGDDWHVKLYGKPGIELEAGQTYTVTMNVTGADGCTACYKNTATGAEDGFGTEVIGSGTVTHTVTPTESGMLEILLKIGNVPANTDVKVSNIQITKGSGGFAPIKLSSFGYPVSTEAQTSKGSFDLEANSGAEAVLTGNGSSATATVTKSGDDWHVKLYGKPGIELEAGQTYKISMNVSGASGCTACYKNTATGAEDGFGTETIGSGTVTHTVTPTESGTLEILLKIGNVSDGTSVSVSNVQIKKAMEGYEPISTSLSYPVTTDAVVETIPEGYVAQPTSLSASAVAWNGSEASVSGTTLNVTKAREDGGIWSIRLEVDTGVVLEKGEKYSVSGKVTSQEGNLPFEVLYSNGSGTDEGAHNPGGQGYAEGSWELNVESAGGSTSFSKEFTVPERSEYRPLVLRVQVGNTTAPNAITVSNVSVKKWVPEHEEVISEASTSNGSFALEANSGAEAQLTGTGSSAVVTVTTPGDDWHVKLYAKPNVALEAGKTYRISMNVNGASGCTAWYKNTATGAEDGFGTETIGSGTVTHTVTPTDSGTLEILLKIGNVSAGTEVKVSGIKIEEYTEGETNVSLESFGYPSTTEGSLTKNAFDLEANSGAEAVLTGDGSSATAKVTTPGDDWHVKLYAKPNVALEAGKTYRISMNVNGASGCTAWYKNTATGAEDGFGTETIGSGTVTHTVTPTDSGTLEILLKIGNVSAGTEVKVSGIKIEEYTEGETNVSLESFGYPSTTEGSLTKNAFDLEANSGAEAVLTGDGSSATAKVTTPGDDWHVKLYAKPNVVLEAGKTYRISMNVNGASGCTAWYKNTATGAEDGFGTETIGSGTVTHTVTPTDSGTLEILLKIGNVSAGTEVKVSGIEIAEETNEEANILPDSFAYPVTTPGSLSESAFELETNNGTVGTLSGDGSSAVTTVTTPGDDWHIKLYAKTGLELKAGEIYQISMDVDGASGCTACYKNATTGAEDGFGTETIGSGTVTHTMTPNEDGTLEILLKLGNVPAGSTVTVRNVKVEKSALGTAVNVLSDNLRFDSQGYIRTDADSGYVADLSETKESATLTISEAPAERHPWNVKLHVKTGFTPEKNKGYRVSFDLNAAKAQKLFEVFYDGNAEAAYGKLVGQSLSAGKKTVSYIIQPGDSKGELVLQIRVGETDGTDGNVYTVSGVKIEEVTFERKEQEITKATVTTFVHETYEAATEKTANTATMRITRSPQNAEPWKAKLFIETGVTLQVGQKYRIRFDVRTDQETGYEVCFNNGSEEKGLGAMYGLTAYPETRTVEYTVYAIRDTDLVVQLSLGDVAAPNAVTISDLRVEKAGAMTTVSETAFTFR